MLLDEIPGLPSSG
jgi:hypothetical protein